MVDAYNKIYEAMPQFAKLHETFGNDESFQVVLSLVYQDILEFHRRAYKFFRRRAWHIFFDSLWKGFQFRFNGIISNIADHKKLLMQQVFVINVTEAKQWRLKNEEEVKSREKLARDGWFHDSISWLKVTGVREDELTELGEKRHEGTCEWVFGNALFHSWKDDAHGEPVLWVKGIPGAGKPPIPLIPRLERRLTQYRQDNFEHLCHTKNARRRWIHDCIPHLQQLHNKQEPSRRDITELCISATPEQPRTCNIRS